MITDIKAALHALADPDRAKQLSRYFKTGPGDYAAGDIFIGVTVPVMRKIAQQFRDLSVADLHHLIVSSIHEERFLALAILVLQYVQKSEEVYTFYLDNRRYINNWDLVDLSAPQIMGAHLFGRDRTILFDLARSAALWDRRIAIVATHYFIRNKDFSSTLRLAEELLTDPHDLIHKAAGWMLREVGKRDIQVLEGFLDQHALTMPRTMLRYTIERFPEDKRKSYLKRTKG